MLHDSIPAYGLLNLKVINNLYIEIFQYQMYDKNMFGVTLLLVNFTTAQNLLYFRLIPSSFELTIVLKTCILRLKRFA